MKTLLMNIFVVSALLLATVSSAFAQVSINTDNSAPDSSAMLDIKSSSKGFLPPRMTHAELNAIINPADGLMVYCIDCGLNGTGTISMFMAGAVYTLNANCLNPLSPVPGTHESSRTQIVWHWNKVLNATGYKWNITDDFATATNMGLDTTKTETGLVCQTPYTRYVWTYSPCGVSGSRVLSQTTSSEVINSPTSGTHIPSLTQIVWKWNTVAGATGYKWSTSDDTANAIDVGLSLLNVETGLTCNTSYTRYLWAYSDCGISSDTTLTQATLSLTINVPTVGTHVASATQIVWNWNTVSGATGYKWSTTHDYATATDIGNTPSKTETGLTCDTGYTRYAWAYGACGHSAPLTMNQSTSECPVTCPSSITKNHIAGTVAPVTKTVTYGIVTNMPGEPSKCWITSNLGADHQATALNDATEASAGWYWQFNRKQGFKHDGTIRTPNTTWIDLINEASDWITANDPCAIELGTGWRIPSSTEWTNVLESGGWTTSIDPWKSGLKMHAAGYLWGTTGSLTDRGSNGSSWSSIQYQDTYGHALCYYGYGLYLCGPYKAHAISLRCLRDPSNSPITPTVATSYTSNITETTASNGGNVTSDGGATVTARGVCWSTSPNPTLAYSHSTDGSGTGTFVSSLTGLTPNTTYYYRAYATNSVGTSYGVELIFTTQSLAIGQSYGGGIIFYIDGTGQHGLISATTDQSNSAQWGCYELIGTSTDIGTGQTNTTLIVNGCSTPVNAARICDDLVLNGYNDWFLPSRDELNQMYLQKTVIGDFANYYYYSSSESYENEAWIQHFGDGAQYIIAKGYGLYVRAVRAF